MHVQEDATTRPVATPARSESGDQTSNHDGEASEKRVRTRQARLKIDDAFGISSPQYDGPQFPLSNGR